ncbi:septal ring lytic transglycosylase RlpA family protein [Streptosporangium sp. NPDC006007]|uniref:septal ring lytic transglycosylase RlpA family protein n=1 Tax=Streptosporangium sp. NPDC006007 TaxID=3154575 RepID=UPI0033B6C008
MLAAGAAVAVSAGVWALSTSGNAPWTAAGLSGARNPVGTAVPSDGPASTVGNSPATGGRASVSPVRPEGTTDQATTPEAATASVTTVPATTTGPGAAKGTTGPSSAPRATIRPSATATPTDAATPAVKSTSKIGKTGEAKVAPEPKTHVISTGTCGASFYGEPQMTASGEQFNPNAMTAAHKSLPLGSKVRVTNPANGESVTVRINDRGPYVGGRCLDLSRAAFSAIGDTAAGVMRVKYEVLGN